jgi:hypothetical protein
VNRMIRSLLGLTGLFTALFVLSAGSALAAPQLEVSLTRDEAVYPTVYHSDERVDLTVDIENVASPLGAPSGGDSLSCYSVKGSSSEGGNWSEDFFVNYKPFEFRWYRDGAPLTAWHTAPKVLDNTEIDTYTVQPADAGHPLQCLVRATNGAGTGTQAVASMPAIVPDPQPPVAPPVPDSPGSFQSRPSLSGTASTEGDTLKCTAPTSGWSTSDGISPIAWSFQWLRDGEPAPGAVTPLSATESEYELTAVDVSVPSVFQCLATATNAAGHSVVVESRGETTSAPAPTFSFEGENRAPFFSGTPPLVEQATNTITSPLTVEVELPAGLQTYASKTSTELEGLGGEEPQWDCAKLPAAGAQPARALCTISKPLQPGNQFPPLEVIVALGADAPDLSTAKATAFGAGAPTASDELTIPLAPALPFLSQFSNRFVDDADADFTKAGAHPDKVDTKFVFNTKRTLEKYFTKAGVPIESVKQVDVTLPPGSVGNPFAIPELCPDLEAMRHLECENGSIVGAVNLVIGGGSPSLKIYAMEPPDGVPAEFMFTDILGGVYVLRAHVTAEDGYAISVVSAPTPGPSTPLYSIRTAFCSYGVKDTGFETGNVICLKPGEPGAFSKPFLTNPTRCGVPLETRALYNSWEDTTFREAPPSPYGPIEDCDEVPFEPTMTVTPTSNVTDSPTGLDAELSIPTDGLEEADGISQSHLKAAKVTLPEGIAINAAGANGLEACSPAQIGLHNSNPPSCPDASRIGSVEVVTPLLQKPLDGAVYQAEQDNNPFGSTLAIYVTAESDEQGVRIKLAGEVELDPTTGQITTTFTDNPQLPFGSFKLKFFGGATAPLRTPKVCGDYSTTSELTPWSAPDSPVTDTDTVSIVQSPGGGGCPSSEGAMPHAPEFDGGTITPVASAYSPFVVRLRRADGSQRFSSVSLTPPPGLTAKLAGTPTCPDAALAAADGRDGTEEQSNPSCPAASHVGTAHVATGAGPAPYWATGEVYLAGPYKGAPLSLAIVTPAVAGPFDLGTVVVRTALRVDPITTQITAVSDPIPQMLEGIPLDVQTVAIAMGKPQFTRNGTNCEPLSFSGQVLSPLGQAASLSQRFQLGECARLGFKPKVKLTLKGGTHRTDYQGLRAVVEAREGDANIGRTAVTLPHAAFLAQNHIRTVCTRVQFAADQCPAGSIYGRASATSPLLDYTLQGNVYLRSSDNPLPDLVVKLRGPDSQPIEVDLAGRTDSVKGALRNTFDVVPDAPVGKFTLELFGGKRGLIQLSTDDYCAAKHRATVDMGAQNGRQLTLRPVVRSTGCGTKQRKRRHKRG